VWRWTKSVSWNRVKTARECPKKLEFMIQRTPTRMLPNYYSNMGHIVQKVFELYYNREYHLHSQGQNVEVVRKIAVKVMQSDWFKDLNTIYQDNDFLQMQGSVLQQVSNGYHLLQQVGLGKELVRSEVDVYRLFRGLKLTGRLDFLHEIDYQRVAIYDGKGNKRPDADPGQLKFYALLLSETKKVEKAGLIYWRSGIEYVDVSPNALWEFVNVEIKPTLELFHELKVGVKQLNALPDPLKCGRCAWKNVCPEAK